MNLQNDLSQVNKKNQDDIQQKRLKQSHCSLEKNCVYTISATDLYTQEVKLFLARHYFSATFLEAHEFYVGKTAIKEATHFVVSFKEQKWSVARPRSNDRNKSESEGSMSGEFSGISNLSVSRLAFAGLKTCDRVLSCCKIT